MTAANTHPRLNVRPDDLFVSDMAAGARAVVLLRESCRIRHPSFV